jgi:hypothetical protein
MRKYSEEMHLKDINLKTSVFWSWGNKPTQENRGLASDVVLNNLKMLYLLSDKILAATSFYYESAITQKITKQLKELFEDGTIMYFIDEDLENAIEHGKKKISHSPKGLSAYRNKADVIARGKEVDSLGNILKRPNESISDKMVELWVDDVLQSEQNSVGLYLENKIESKEELTTIRLKLIDFARNRKKDFVWEYTKPFLLEQKLSDESFLLLVKSKLSQIYAWATSEILGVNLDENIKYGTITKNSKYDSYLFMQCLNQLRVLEPILNLTNSELKILKYSFELSIFREFYFKLIESFVYKSNDILKSFGFFIKFEEFYKGSDERNAFIENFSKFCKTQKLPKTQYKKPLEYIKNNL